MAGLARSSAGSTRRLIALEMIGACLVILVLAQAFIGLLSLASFSRLATAATSERVELLARDIAAQIETGLRLGKPLAQYTGLGRLLETNVQAQPDLLRASVVLPDGRVLADYGTDVPPAGAALGPLVANGAEAALPGGTVLQRGGATLEIPGRIGL